MTLWRRISDIVCVIKMLFGRTNGVVLKLCVEPPVQEQKPKEPNRGRKHDQAGYRDMI
jgi:hypothetical protein